MRHSEQDLDNATSPGELSKKPMKIAIVGMSGRYPRAENLDALWQNLRTGVDGISEAKGDRWDLGYHVKESDKNNRIYTKFGGFLDRIDGFDAEFFGMSPREATQVDPQHRLLLELAWEALESANIKPSSLAGSKTGVFVGISNQDYSSLSGQVVDAYTNIGSAMSIASNRISYVFDLHGPSMSIDTACSSSLVAMHQACNALMAGDCSMALVGGVNMLASTRPWVGFAKASMLSPDGRCKSFDAEGNGYVRAEGGGIVIVKPLEAAERDGDEILGVILATGVNSDGRTLGLALPNGDAQEALLRQVYAASGIAAEDVYYVEAHGTGTSAGDPIECGAIGRVLGKGRSEGPLHIGSIKSNIGHLESGAGTAGLTKLLLAIKHREIPANLHFKTPNPKIEFDTLRLKVVDQNTPLPERERPLCFGINSFGFGGTNAHLVLQEYRKPKPEKSNSQSPEVHESWGDMLRLSARTAPALTETAKIWAKFLSETKQNDVPEILAAAAHDRDILVHGIAVSGTVGEMVERLQSFAETGSAPGLVKTRALDKPTKVALVYSGNGPQWWGMGRELMAQSAIFRNKMQEIDSIFLRLSGWSLIELMGKPESEVAISKTEIAQPLLFAQQVALTDVLKSAGLKAELAFGHSVGEVAAAHAAGALDLETACMVIFHRSSMQALTEGNGRMAAIGLSAEDALKEMAVVGGWLEIAAVNSPKAVTVAGELGALEKLRDRLTDQGHFVRILPLNYAFHTKAMDATREGLLQRLSGIQANDGTMPFVSTVSGKVTEGQTLKSDYWWNNIREPVQFSGAVQHAVEQFGANIFVEIGPHPVMSEYINQTLKAIDTKGALSVATLRRPSEGKPAPEVATLQSNICTLFAVGAIDPAGIFPKASRGTKLPNYPWQRSRLWRGHVELPDSMVAAKRVHAILGAEAPSADGLWNNTLQNELLPWMQDHVVQGAVLFPAAGYIEASLAAAKQLHGDGPLQLDNFEIMKPLVVADGAEPMLQVSMDKFDGTLSVRSRPSAETEEWTSHLRGRACKIDVDVVEQQIDLEQILASAPVSVEPAAHYEDCARRGMSYGPMFQGVKSLRLTDPAAEQRMVIAALSLPVGSVLSCDGYAAHPSIVDSALQLIIALMAQNDLRNCAAIPVFVERIRHFGQLPVQVYGIGEFLSENSRTGVAKITITDRSGKILLVLDGARFQKVEFKKTDMQLLSECWQLDAEWHASHPIILPEPKSLVANLKPIATVEATRANARINELAGAYAVRSLQQLLGGTQAFTKAALRRKSGIGEDRFEMLDHLVAMVGATGSIWNKQGEWQWNPVKTGTDCEALFKDAMEQHPGHMPELMALARAGNALISDLRSEETPAQSVAMLDVLEDQSAYRRNANQMAASALEKLVMWWPKTHAMRVVELDASTGGLTATILPVLPADRLDYLALCTSEAAAARLKSRFGKQHFFRTATSNVASAKMLHDVCLATVRNADLISGGDVLSSASERLCQGGIGIFLVNHGSRFDELVFGTRPAAAMTPEQIVEAFEKAGFAEIAIIPDGQGLPLHSLVVARRCAVPVLKIETKKPDPRKLLLLVSLDEKADQVDNLKVELETIGQNVLVRQIDFEAVSDPQMKSLVQDAGDVEEFVFLGNLKNSATPEIANCAAALSLVRAIETISAEQPGGVVSRLSLVTRGAFAGPNMLGSVNPTQAGLAALGRVIANEHATLRPRVIDVSTGETMDSLARAIALDDAEPEVMLLNGQRWLARVDENLSATMNAQSDVSSRQFAEAFKLDFIPQRGLDSLHLAPATRRAPAPGEVEIRVRAAGLNFRDVLWTMGMLPEEAVEKGFSGPTIGMECSGEVVRVGEGVSNLKPGDHVIAFASSCFGSHVTTKAGCVAPAPSGMSFEEAATIPTAFVTAWYALDHLARLEAGETVLIHGAAGGVGLAALQIAKLKGAVVIGTAGAHDKQRLVKAMGADHVLSSRSLKFADDVMQITDGKGVDIVLNSLAGEAITKGLEVLRPFGRFLEIGKRDLYANSRIGLRPFRQNLSYFGIDADTLLVEREALARRVFEQVAEAMAKGMLNPLPYQSMPVQRAAEGFRAMQQARHVGKIVITVGDDVHVPSQKPAINNEGTYLVTGGLSGFGLASAIWLAEQGASSLALLGRRGPSTPEALEGIAKIKAMGVDVRGFSCDVSDYEQLDRTLVEIRQTMAPLKGVFHAAAVIEDAPIVKVDKGLFERVYGAKVSGAFHLDKLTRNDDLDQFVLYSSSSALVGNPGQAAYVAANYTLDMLAEKRHAEGLPALSVAWGAIKDAGFLTRNQDVEAMLAQRAGMEATPTAAAFATLGRLLSSGTTRVAAAQFNLMRLGQSLAGARTSRFSLLMTESMMMAREGAGDVANALDAMSDDERRAFLAVRVREHVARVVGSAADQIDNERSLTDLGLDSLMAVELAEAIEHDIGKPVSVMQMIQAGNVNNVVEVLLRALRAGKQSAGNEERLVKTDAVDKKINQAA